MIMKNSKGQNNLRISNIKIFTRGTPMFKHKKKTYLNWNFSILNNIFKFTNTMFLND